MNNFKNRVLDLQKDMKAPKNQHNDFGRYDYRTAEGIYKVAKPLLSKYKIVLTVSDELTEIAGRVYVKATAKLCDTETTESISATAYAQDTGEKKGMDASQVTGSASSYARKYAMNGLFLLDDGKDTDSNEFSKMIEDEAKENKLAKETTKEKAASTESKRTAVKPENVKSAPASAPRRRVARK